MTKRIRVETFGFMQQFKAEHFDWSEDEKDEFFTTSDSVLKHICARIYDGLKSSGATGEALEFEFCGINHNKDTSLIYDPVVQDEVFVQKDEHFHGVVRLKSKRDIQDIAKWIGIEPQYVESPHKGRYGRENMLAYLIHAKQPEKYQYKPEEVKTFGTFDYMAYYNERKPDWDRQKDRVSAANSKVNADWLVKRVQRGELTKRQIMKNEHYSEVYADNITRVNEAFQYLGEKKGYETLEALENGEFTLSAFFIHGKSGAGKTQAALELIRNLTIEKGWDCYQASVKSPMDGYNGEEIILMDDFRATTLEATEWLQILDPRTTASIGARYKNKQKAHRVLIITSHFDPFEFFSRLKTNEPLDQFIRRLMMVLEVINVDGKRIMRASSIGINDSESYYDFYMKQLRDGTPPIESENYQALQFGIVDVAHGGTNEVLDYVKNIVKHNNNKEYDHRKNEMLKISEIERIVNVVDEEDQ